MLIHEIKPIYNQNSKVLLLGSFPSPKSREQGFFYGHPQNRMWRVLARIFCDTVPETVSERREFLFRHHIAMWDVLESCEIKGANDSSIKNTTPNDLSIIFSNANIAAVFTTGGKAAQCYRKYNEKKYEIPHIQLPSTSPANATASLDELTAAYMKVRLFTLSDKVYAVFQAKLTPGIPKDKFIGVRVPEARKLAKLFSKEPAFQTFLSTLPHDYYEENILHGILISEINDYNKCITAIDQFLPYVDNWAVCDIISPEIFKNHKHELIRKIREWTASEETYTCRFGVKMLMTHYLDEDFKPEYLKIPANIYSNKYYVNMMIAWFFATALAKQWDTTVPYIENKRLDKPTHNKTIQKSCESRRINDEQKSYLKKFKL